MTQLYQNILVGLDGSPQAEVALRKALQLAQESGAKIYLAHVVDTSPISSFASRSESYEDLEDPKVMSALEDYRRFIKDSGYDNVELLVEYGSPRDMMAEKLPKKYNIDLIMVGATGMGAVNRVFMGSIAEYITRNAIVDVTVVRTPSFETVEPIRRA